VPDTTSGMADDVPPSAAVRANRAWWDREAAGYQAEHATFLAGRRSRVPDQHVDPEQHSDAARHPDQHVDPARAMGPAALPAALVWCPEGLEEVDARLLGPREDLVGARTLEVGAGAAQGSRWVAEQGASVVALDLSVEMLLMRGQLDRRGEPEQAPHGRGEDLPARTVPALQGDACHLPLADDSMDLAFSAYGALPFVADAGAVLAEVARVLRPGGRFVCSVTHPFRWSLPDDPGWDGLRVSMSYFDRRPYVEHREDGSLDYAEYHRTVGDWVRLIRAAGLVLQDLVEPEWPEDLQQTWGGWSPLRGHLPGTAVLVTTLP